MPSVTEFTNGSLDVLERKYLNTLACVELPDGETGFVYVRAVGYNDQGEPIFIDPKGNEYPTRPVYHHFKSGYYRYDKSWICISRRPKNSFHIGLSQDSYVLSKYNGVRFVSQGFTPNYTGIDFDFKCDKDRALYEGGPISEKLFVSPDKVFYLTTPIGFRNNGTFALSEKFLIQEVEDAVKHASYLGIKCKVTSL